jgi:hypothetical protein
MTRGDRSADGLLADALTVAIDREGLLELLKLSRRAMAREPAMVALPARRLLVVGDLHGHLGAAAWVASELLARPDCHLVALGDYVDRGDEQLPTLALMLELRLAESRRVTLLRGNHETPRMNDGHGFARAVLEAHGQEVLDACHAAFAELPIAAHRKDGVLCLHGGIPRGARTVDDIGRLPKGGREPTGSDVLEVLWNDPEERRGGFAPNHDRGIGMTFGQDATCEFMARSDLWLLVRAHQPSPEGAFRFHGGRGLSLFSHPGYHGMANEGAAALVGTDRSIETVTIEPVGRGIRP